MRLIVFTLVLGLAPAVSSVARAQTAEPAPQSTHLSGRDPDPEPARVVVEQLFFLAVGAVWYWIDKEKNAIDWDYDSWLQRFDEDAFRFDNNRFQVNWVFHPFAGSTYYGFARANDVHAGWAFSSVFLTSFAWEWLLEFKERFSINDQIATSVGGMALGEFWYKLGRWLHVRATTPARRAAAWTLGLGVQAHEAIDGDRPTQAERDALHAEFRLRYGGSLLFGDADTAGLHSVAFEGRIVEMPGYHRVGRLRRAFGDANFTQLRARGTRGHRETGGGFELDADTILAGLHVQDLEEDGGGSATIGAAIGYTYRRLSYEGFADRVGAIHLPGLAFEGMLRHRWAALRLSVRGYGDFASADAQEPFDAWAIRFPDERTKTILEREGYFYGWGATGSMALALGLGPVELGLRAAVSRWSSQERLDRSQEELTLDVEADSRRIAMDVWARVELPYGLHVEARYDELRKNDRVGDQQSERRLQRLGLAVGLTR